MTSLTVNHQIPPVITPFLRGWRSLPDELRLQILSHVLTINPTCGFPGPKITIHDFRPSPSLLSCATCRFMKLALPLLACSEVDELFDLPQATLEVFYSTNTFFLGGPCCGGYGQGMSYPYCVPNRTAFAHLQRVEVHIRGIYTGWMDLAKYCEVSKQMPKLKEFGLDFVRQTRHELEYKSLQEAFAQTGKLEVSAKKFVFRYFGMPRLLFEIPQLTIDDRVDHPEMAEVFAKINIDSGDKAVKEVTQRYWYDRMNRVDVDEMWELPPQSQFPWEKYVVRTQWM